MVLTEKTIEEQAKLLLTEYTSQVLSHAGYTITLGFGFFAVASPIISSYYSGVTNGISLFFELLGISAILILAFYFFCRSFYYNELSNIVKTLVGLGGESLQRYYLNAIEEFENKRKGETGMSVVSVAEVIYRINYSGKYMTSRGTRKLFLKFATYRRKSLSGEESKVWAEVRNRIQAK